MNPPVRRPPPTIVPLDGLLADVAMKLYARTGLWPDCFVWVVGDVVPQAYVERALELRCALGFGSTDVVRAKPVNLPEPIGASRQLAFEESSPTSRRGRRAA